MLHFLHPFSREVADNTPISSAIKGCTCVFDALSGNYSLERGKFGKIFLLLVAVASQSVRGESRAICANVIVGPVPENLPTY